MTDELNRSANEVPPVDERAVDALILDERTSDLTSAHVPLAIAGVDPLPGPSLLSALGWMLLFLVGQSLIVVAFSIALSVALATSGKKPPEIMEGIQPWATAMATAGSLLMAVLITGAKFGSQTFHRLGLRRPDAVQLLIVALLVSPLAVLANVLAGVVDYWLPVSWDPQSESILQLATNGWASIVIAGSLFPAVGEEIFFRGFLGRGLVARLGPVGGMILTSLAFGLFHLMPAQIAGTFLLGLGFHFAYLATRSLPAAMAMHFLINVEGLSLLFLQAPPGGQPPAEAAEAAGYSSLLILLSVLAVGLLSLSLYRLRTRWEFNPDSPWQVPYVTGETPPVPARATCDSLAQHLGLIVIAALAWIAFAVLFARALFDF